MDIDEAAAELGITLSERQRETGQAILDGKLTTIQGGKRNGRKVLAMVIAHARRKNGES